MKRLMAGSSLNFKCMQILHSVPLPRGLYEYLWTLSEIQWRLSATDLVLTYDYVLSMRPYSSFSGQKFESGAYAVDTTSWREPCCASSSWRTRQLVRLVMAFIPGLVRANIQSILYKCPFTERLFCTLDTLMSKLLLTFKCINVNKNGIGCTT